MITKGIVTEKLNNKYKVRIPLYDKVEGSANSTRNQDLSWAILNTQPFIKNPINVGDTVIIGFEQNDIGKPIILGVLYLDEKDYEKNNEVDLFIRNLQTYGLVNLSEQTWIGKTKPKDFINLQNTKENLQAQIDELTKLTKSVKDEIINIDFNLNNATYKTGLTIKYKVESKDLIINFNDYSLKETDVEIPANQYFNIAYFSNSDIITLNHTYYGTLFANSINFRIPLGFACSPNIVPGQLTLVVYNLMNEPIKVNKIFGHFIFNLN